MNIDQIRKDSPVTAHYAYFDTGAAAPPPLSVLNAVIEYLKKTAELGIYLPSLRKEIYANVEQIHADMALFLGAEPPEIAFTKNATESICVIAQGIDWQAGDEVIVPDTEILSNLSPWLRLEKTRGIKVIHAKANSEGLLETAHIEQLITPKTRLLTFGSLSNATGALQDAKSLCSLAKKHGILSLVNASQSLGLVETNVRDLDCDFLAGCGRKGLRAIEGTGILYVRNSLIDTLEPCLIGWWNSSIDPQTQELILPNTAKRFEAGCPNVPAILSLGAALKYATALEMPKIQARVDHLTRYAVTALSSIIGFTLYGPLDASKRIGLIPFNIIGKENDCIDPNLLVTMLEKNGVIIEAGHFMAHAIMQKYQIERMARISLHYFNTEEEIDKTVDLIKNFILTYSAS
ncbi:cysteine desulfurase [Gammaproteobacteria bacterium]|nr:cysteine desulfurase [Gammaproteobacteria bacterium]